MSNASDVMLAGVSTVIHDLELEIVGLESSVRTLRELRQHDAKAIEKAQAAARAITKTWRAHVAQAETATKAQEAREGGDV